MPILPLYGHEALRGRLRQAVERGTLPASLLLHGPRGIGKQRLALWLGQLLLCTSAAERPCGSCTSCTLRAAARAPRSPLVLPAPEVRRRATRRRARCSTNTPRPAPTARRSTDSTRRRAGWRRCTSPPCAGSLQHAAYTPTMSSRKVIVVGDAERMVAQDGADAAANAFLKLLEEPPADTIIILTTSEPGALLPTIRSRVAALRVAPVAERDVRAWLADPVVKAALDAAGAPKGDDARVDLAAGAPGSLLAASTRDDAVAAARAVLDAATADRATQMRAVFSLGGKRGARRLRRDPGRDDRAAPPAVARGGAPQRPARRPWPRAARSTPCRRPASAPGTTSIRSSSAPRSCAGWRGRSHDQETADARRPRTAARRWWT